MKQRLFAIKCLLPDMVFLLMGTIGDAAGRKADIPLEQVSLPDLIADLLILTPET